MFDYLLSVFGAPNLHLKTAFMKTKSILFCLVFALVANIKTTNAQVNVQDSLALVDLYNSTDGPNWYNHTNWLTKNPVSTWYGVTVTNGRVTTIWLAENNLNGNIPSSIGNLVSLTTLYLTDNHLTGSIPVSMGNLRNVTYLDLSANHLSGNIPSSIGKLEKLEFLDLYFNELNGSIPSSFGNLKNMVHLAISGNQLTGSIPFSFSKLTNLRYLLLSSNQLSGNIPSSISELVNLEYLLLANNQFTGNIPFFIGKFTNLIELDLGSNQLAGVIPSFIGNLVNLEVLDLRFNHFSGNIPSPIGKLVNLTNLYLHNNKLSGSIPSSLGNLANLIYFLNLSNNELSGSIPSSFNKLPTSLSIDVSHNRFTFDGMELIAQTFPDAVYNKQKNIPVLQNGNTLSVSTGGTLSNNTYKWFKYEGTTPILVATIKGDSVFHPSENGRYRAKVLNSVATQLQLYSKLFDYTAPNNAVIASAENTLQQRRRTNLFLVYPNPARDIIYVQTNGDASFSLLNQSGKILVTANINGNGEINVTNLAAGLYYLRNHATWAVQKVVVAK